MSEAAQRLRRAVDDAGGRWETTVRALRDHFGIARLTAPGRARIVRELLAQDLEIEPPLGELPLSAPVELVDVRVLSPAAARAARQIVAERAVVPGAEVEPARDASGVAPEPAAASAAWRRRAEVGIGVAVGLVVAVLIVVAGVSSRDGGGGAPVTSIAMSTAPPVDDRAARYAAALALGREGRHLAAHEAMRDLIPYRRSEQAARSFAVRAAQGLLADARARLPEDPQGARRLLAQASSLAPELSSLAAVRAAIAAA